MVRDRDRDKDRDYILYSSAPAVVFACMVNKTYVYY